MTHKVNSEIIKRKLYQTLHRFGLSKYPIASISSNIYIDDSGFVMIMHADGLTSTAGELSLTGEFICTTKTD